VSKKDSGKGGAQKISPALGIRDRTGRWGKNEPSADLFKRKNGPVSIPGRERVAFMYGKRLGRGSRKAEGLQTKRRVEKKPATNRGRGGKSVKPTAHSWGC